jgi:large subunit ribosomal protein L31
MKPDTHPEYNKVVFKDGEHEIVTRSTATSQRTREIDGEEHYVIPIDISAYTHPFYTGQKKLVDTEGRVDRFFKRYNLDNPEDEGEEEEAEAEADEQAEEESADQEESAEDEATAEDEE